MKIRIETSGWSLTFFSLGVPFYWLPHFHKVGDIWAIHWLDVAFVRYLDCE